MMDEAKQVVIAALNERATLQLRVASLEAENAALKQRIAARITSFVVEQPFSVHDLGVLDQEEGRKRVLSKMRSALARRLVALARRASVPVRGAGRAYGKPRARIPYVD